MAEFIKNFFGQKPLQAQPAPSEDADFADFAGAPDPSPAVLSSIPEASHTAEPPRGIFGFGSAMGPVPMHQRPYTKWYRVWERVTVEDFYPEFFIIPFLLLLIGVHLWGTRKNRSRAKAWMSAHAPSLQQEFALTGFKPNTTGGAIVDPSSASLSQDLMREEAPNEFITYASGRYNTAFVDVKLRFHKRYNPPARIGEFALGFFMDDNTIPGERLEATAYTFQGRENELLPKMGGQLIADREKINNSSYDGFVFAIVHKNLMNDLRRMRYDLSLTSTKDHPKLPGWATVMSENAEITDTMLTPELIKAIKEVGDLEFQALIVTDQPVDKPKTLNDLVPKKCISLMLGLPNSFSVSAYEHSVPLFQYFLRMPDFLVANARFRPEALKRVKATREDEVRKIQKVDEEEKSDERKRKADKEKKEKRDAQLKNMTPDEQRKFLEKERASELRKSQKGRTQRA